MANGDLKNQLAQRAATAPKAVRPEDTVAEYIKRMGPEIAQALPKHMDPDRLARIALTTIRTTPKLLQCNIQSLMGAVMQAAQLGLEPGLLGHCYIIPFGNEAQFMIGYRGMIDLARRSGNIESIQAHEVYENDYFKLKYGLEDTLEHIPWHLREDQKFDEPGAFRGCYMVAKFKDGGHQIHYMSKKEIDDHRKRSKAGNSGPWVTDYIEMAKKTVVRSAWKWLPISVEIMRQAEAADESVKREIAPDMADVPNVIDSTAEEEPQAQPEPEESRESPQPQEEPKNDAPKGLFSEPPVQNPDPMPEAQRRAILDLVSRWEAGSDEDKIIFIRSHFNADLNTITRKEANELIKEINKAIRAEKTIVQ